MEDLKPKNRAETVALFRSEIVGALVRRDLARGDLAAALVELAKPRYRPPDAKTTRSYSVPTLERWYYAYKQGGLVALEPEARSDRGRAHDLTVEQRELMLDIRREHPSASVPLILRTLVADGRLGADAVSAATVRRLYREQGLDRDSLNAGGGRKTRLRWQAEKPGALWHGDVCYGPTIVVGGKQQPLRIHGLLDDASRYIIAIEAHHTEKEVDMLGLFVRALRGQSAPAALYLDNGSTYRGKALQLGCERLGVTLIHAEPYDAPARGKMERFWRTLRQGCLDFIGGVTSLHDVNVRLWAFLDKHYHVAPHGGLLGRAPGAVYAEAERIDSLTEEKIRDALTVRERRRVRRDTSVSIEGTDWELDQGFLAGRVVVVARSLAEPGTPPWVEHEGKRLPLHLIDPIANARKTRERPAPSTKTTVPFDPPKALLDRALGRKPNKEQP